MRRSMSRSRTLSVREHVPAADVPGLYDEILEMGRRSDLGPALKEATALQVTTFLMRRGHPTEKYIDALDPEIAALRRAEWQRLPASTLEAD